MIPVFAGLGRTVAKNTSIGDLHGCAEGIDILIIYIEFTTWTAFADCENWL